MVILRVKIIVRTVNSLHDLRLNEFLKGKKLNHDYKMTTGTDIIMKKFRVDENTEIKYFFWDIGNNERFKLLRKIFYAGGMGGILIFNLDEVDSWIELQDFYKEIQKTNPDLPCAILGLSSTPETLNKMDEKNLIHYIEWSEMHNSIFYLVESEDKSQILDFISHFSRKLLDSIEFNVLLSPTPMSSFLSQKDLLDLLLELNQTHELNLNVSKILLRRKNIPLILEKMQSIHTEKADKLRKWAVRELELALDQFTLIL